MRLFSSRRGYGRRSHPIVIIFLLLLIGGYHLFNHFYNFDTKKQTVDLETAVVNGDLENVKYQISKKADVNLTNISGETLLHKAASRGFVEIAEILINSGAKVNEKDVARKTPLVEAVEHGHKDMVKLLISKRADVNTKNISEMTPLHNAVMKGDPEIVEMLIEAGADVNAKANEVTPLLIALHNENEEIAEILKKNGGKI